MLIRSAPAVLTIDDRVVASATITGTFERHRLAVAGTITGRPHWLCDVGVDGLLTWVINPANPKSEVVALDGVRVTAYDAEDGRIAFAGKGRLLTTDTGAYAGTITR